MPRGVKKENLPSKICVVCNRPFTWRKKWERCWDEVLCCSERCKNERKRNKRSADQKTCTEQGTGSSGAAGGSNPRVLPVNRRTVLSGMQVARRLKIF